MKLVILITENGNGVRRGEVIEAVPDSHAFSPLELAHPNWRIVSADIVEAEADGLLAAPVNVPGEAKPWRRMRLDVDNLPDVLTRADLYARVVEQ